MGYQVCDGVKILPLKWRRHNGEWFCFPKALGVPYTIIEMGDDGYYLEGAYTVLTKYGDLKTAKEFAERDYHRRVLSALDLSETKEVF